MLADRAGISGRQPGRPAPGRSGHAPRHQLPPRRRRSGSPGRQRGAPDPRGPRRPLLGRHLRRPRPDGPRGRHLPPFPPRSQRSLQPVARRSPLPARRQQGQVWVGTAGRLEPHAHRRARKISFQRYTVKDGMSDDAVAAILEDSAGFLWVSTNTGISRLEPLTGKWRNYSAVDGTIEGAYFDGSALRAPDGTLYFGGFNGVTAFNPRAISDNRIPPRAVVDRVPDLQPAGRTGAPGRCLRRRSSAPARSRWRLRFRIFARILGPALRGAAAQPLRLPARRLRPRLGRHRRRASRFATYTNLDPGTYTFRVKAANKDGVWGVPGDPLIITVLPPVWKTWWFRTLAALMLLGCGWLAYRGRLSACAARRRCWSARSARAPRRSNQQNRLLEQQKRELEARALRSRAPARRGRAPPRRRRTPEGGSPAPEGERGAGPPRHLGAVGTPQPCQAQGRGRDPPEVGIPGQHEPRDAHAAGRRDRHARLRAARRQAAAGHARAGGARPGQRPVAAGDHQRPARLLQDRGGQAGDREHRLQPRATRSKTWSACSRSRPRRTASTSPSSWTTACRASWSATRPACARCWSTWSAMPSSSPTQGKVTLRVERAAAGEAPTAST